MIAGLLLNYNSPAPFQAFDDLNDGQKAQILELTRACLAGEIDDQGLANGLPDLPPDNGRAAVVVTLWPAWEMQELRRSVQRASEIALRHIDPEARALSVAPPEPTRLRAAASGESYASALAASRSALIDIGLDPRLLDCYRLQVELVREIDRLRLLSDFFTNRSLQRGVSGVAWSDGQALSCAMPDDSVRLELHPRNFISRLKAGRGIEIPLQLDQGLYRFRTDSFIEHFPGRGVQSIYRVGGRIDEISPAQIERACLIGGDFLLRLLKPNGKFYYRYYPLRRKTARDDPQALLGRYLIGDGFDDKGYNLLRHCGTTYSLMQLYDATGLERFREGGERALGWMLKRAVPMPGVPGALVMLEDGRNQAKLGGAGLAILALVAHARATGDMSHKDAMDGLARGICQLQLPNGDFINYASMNPNRPAKNRRSIYYPGEAIFGLVRLYQLDGNPQWLEYARRGADFLVHDRWKVLWMQMYVPPDAWMMLALEELHEVTGDPAYRDYAYLLAQNMIKDQYLTRAPFPDWLGGYSTSRKLDLWIGPVSTPNVTPAGSRMEGFTAVYLLAQREGDREMMDRIYRTIRAGTTFQISTMIRPETAFLYPDPSMALGGFRHNSSYSKIQIDYNQHNISGLLIARQIMLQREAL
ncbi:MAG: glycoside hydrolase family 127 protein [Candidatus Alcyoniella australis]|nr:glycoside hydrolase family 127 protein [Candidatus Alcyoniella australis]